MMLYTCTYMTTVGVKGLNERCRSSELNGDVDNIDHSAPAVDRIAIPVAQSVTCEPSQDDVDLVTRRRPKTADAELSSVRTSSVATQTTFTPAVIVF